MGERRLLYYITDRSQFEGDEMARRGSLLDKIAEAARAGVDYIQLREKDLSTKELEQLAGEAVRIVGEAWQFANNERRATRLLVNSRTDVALAVGADGVHLRSDDVSPTDVRLALERAGSRQFMKTGFMNDCAKSTSGAQRLKPPSMETVTGTAQAVPFPEPTCETGAARFLVAISCHTVDEVFRAVSQGADLVVFAPVFEKKDAPDVIPRGLEALREACRARIPVLALGGVTLANAPACLEAGASGIAGIRLFQENKICDVVRGLRSS